MGRKRTLLVAGICEVQRRLRKFGLRFLCELESAKFKDCGASGHPRVLWEPGRIAIVASNKE